MFYIIFANFGWLEQVSGLHYSSAGVDCVCNRCKFINVCLFEVKCKVMLLQ